MGPGFYEEWWACLFRIQDLEREDAQSHRALTAKQKSAKPSEDQRSGPGRGEPDALVTLVNGNLGPEGMSSSWKHSQYSEGRNPEGQFVGMKDAASPLVAGLTAITRIFTRR